MEITGRWEFVKRRSRSKVFTLAALRVSARDLLVHHRSSLLDDHIETSVADVSLLLHLAKVFIVAEGKKCQFAA